MRSKLRPYTVLRQQVKRTWVHNTVEQYGSHGVPIADVAGNQKADRMAKDGRKMPSIGPEPGCGIAHELAKQEIKTLLRQ